jgi:AraC family transcriptional regulator
MPLLNKVPRIEELMNLRLIGMHQAMSLVDNRTVSLWQTFRPRLNELSDRIGTDLYSLQQYPSDYFRAFDPTRRFEKWAAASVSTVDHIPTEMDAIVLNGPYAVFDFQGTPAEFGAAIQFILLNWLPGSNYQLDDRPHFERLGDRYKHNDPKSEEEIWIPILIPDLHTLEKHMPCN